MTTDESERYTGYPANLFEWQRLVYVALAHAKISQEDAALALMIALDGDGTTGQRVVVNVDRLTREFAVDERTIYRRFARIKKLGWFEQTSRPTRGRNGQAGRRARYRVTFASVDLSDVLATDHLTLVPDSVSDDSASESPDTHPDGDCQATGAENGFHLTDPAESSDTVHAQSCHSPTSDGPTSTGGTSSTSTTDQAREAAKERQKLRLLLGRGA